MARASFDKTAMLYNFVEKHIWEDYSSACDAIDEYLTLAPQETIIDVGGGTGLIAKLLRSKSKKDDILVVDLSRKMLQKVNDPSIIVLQADVTRIPLRDESCSLALLINTIHHIDEARQKIALQEVFRILKKQGRVFISEIYYPNTALSRLFVLIEKSLVGKTKHLTADEMKQALQEAGFREIMMNFPERYPCRYVSIATKTSQ